MFPPFEDINMATRKQKLDEFEMVDPMQEALVVEDEPVRDEPVEEFNFLKFIVSPECRFGTIQVAGIGFSKYAPVEIPKGSPMLPEILKNPYLVQL